MFEPAILIAIVLGLVEVAKIAFKLKKEERKRFIPAIAVLIGLLVSFIADFSGSIGATILTGIIYGLSAVGLFSGVKNTLGK